MVVPRIQRDLKIVVFIRLRAKHLVFHDRRRSLVDVIIVSHLVGIRVRPGFPIILRIRNTKVQMNAECPAGSANFADYLAALNRCIFIDVRRNAACLQMRILIGPAIYANNDHTAAKAAAAIGAGVRLVFVIVMICTLEDELHRAVHSRDNLSACYGFIININCIFVVIPLT